MNAAPRPGQELRDALGFVDLSRAVHMRAFVYIMANTKRGVMYIGVTSNMSRRLGEHRSGVILGFASSYGAILLVHVEAFESIIDARARERTLKRWRREWKFALIEQDNPDWVDLADKL